jgi:zeaxanthin glucosyltransferase
MKTPKIRTYALLCPPALGHVNPFMALARELNKRGHRTIFYQLKDYESLIIKSGFEVRVYGETEFPRGAWLASAERFATLSGNSAMEHFINVIEKKTLAGLVDLPELIRADRVDAIIADQVGMESASVAEYLNLPFATLCNALPLDSDSTTPPFFTDWSELSTASSRLKNWLEYKMLDVKIQPTMNVVNTWRAKYGLRPLNHRRDSYSKQLKMIRLHQEFDFPRRTNSETYWVGPLIHDQGRTPCAFPWEHLNGKPIVYVSMGSEINRRFASFQLIVDALEKEDIQLVVSLGRENADTNVLSYSASTIVCSFVPQTEVLRKASLFVTHAGLNSVLESICAAVPMLALPTANDQFGISARIRHHGLGDYLLPDQVTEFSLRTLFKKIISSEDVIIRLRKLADSNSAKQAAEKAADLLENFLQNQQNEFQSGAHQ